MKKGFTTIELVFIIIIFGAAVVTFFLQKNRVDSIARDNERKISINAIYHNLEHFYETNNYYPETIDEENLTAMDPALFTDPTGFNLGDEDGMSDYRYEPTDCKNAKCKSYRLISEMEKESDFIKSSRH